MAVQIDPKTGERIEDAPQIDPQTGERVAPVAGAGPLGLPQPPAAPVPNMAKYAGNLETIPSGSDPGIVGGIKTGVHNFGARVGNNLNALAKPIIHPIQTGSDIIQRGGFPLTPDAIKAASYNPSGATAGDTVTNILGDAATGLLTRQAASALPNIARPLVSAVGKTGDMMQTTAADIRNSKFAPTMKEAIRDNNPGRGTLQAGIGTTLNKGSYANKISGATEAVGGQIGNAVTRADQNALAPPIRSSAIAPAITGPIDSAVAKLDGPFGTASTAPYETMRAKLGNTAPGATAPIYGPNAPAEITPSNLWKHIQNIDQNTRFNTDPEVESVNETRRDIRQGLRPSLEAADPTIKPSSRLYSDLLSAGDAVSRTQGGFGIPKGVSSLIDSTIKSTPVVTGASSALFKIGGGLKNFATNAQGGAPASIGFQPKPGPLTPPTAGLLGSGSIASPGGADFTSGGFPGRPSIVTPQPPSLFGLPATAGAGEVQPMLGVPNDYPQLASPFAKERVPPTLFSKPQQPSNGLFTVDPSGQIKPDRLALPAPKATPKKR